MTFLSGSSIVGHPHGQVHEPEVPHETPRFSESLSSEGRTSDSPEMHRPTWWTKTICSGGLWWWQTGRILLFCLLPMDSSGESHWTEAYLLQSYSMMTIDLMNRNLGRETKVKRGKLSLPLFINHTHPVMMTFPFQLESQLIRNGWGRGHPTDVT